MTEWKKEYTMEEPSELLLVSPDTYIQRKNIESFIDNDGTAKWRSDSRFIKKNEYNLLQSIADILVDKAIDDYTMQLIEEGIL